MSFVSKASLDTRADTSDADIEEAILVLKFCGIVDAIRAF